VKEMTIIAYHGFGGSAQMLREDIGSIDLDIHFSDACNVRRARREIERLGVSELSAIGYSRGCRIIADLTCLMPQVFQRVVLYEGPLGRMKAARGNAPALIIWNDQGRGHFPAADEMEIAWNRGGRHVEYLDGIGGHVRKDPELGLRHAWDQKLNRKIVKFLEAK
jgi:dienelactone hydrolase